MAEHLVHALLLQALALSIATLGVLALQATVLRRFGAAAAHVAWLLVPVALLAVALPHPAVDALVVHVDVAALTPAWIASPAPAAANPAWPSVVVVAWSAGAVLLLALLVRRQRGFEAQLSRTGAVARLPAGAGPAVMGLWRRRIVLPLDFDSAFDADERRLMLLHEGVHLRRGDNLWNLLAAALLVLHWFNPIAWWAWRRMRADQETSCDAAVLREESPQALPVYVGALLKVQGVALAAPLATSWQSTHPLVERVRMLHLHRTSIARHRAGLRIAALAILLAGIGGYALRAGASAPAVSVSVGEAAVATAVEIEFDKSASHPTKIASRLLTRGGEKATLRYASDAMKKEMLAPFEVEYTATRLDGGRLRLDTVLSYGEPLARLAAPSLITHDGEAARVEVSSADGAHAFAVTFVPSVLPAPAAPPVPPAPKTLAPPLPALPPLAVPLHTSPPPALPLVPSTATLPPLPAAPAVPAAPLQPAP